MSVSLQRKALKTTQFAFVHRPRRIGSTKQITMVTIHHRLKPTLPKLRYMHMYVGGPPIAPVIFTLCTLLVRVRWLYAQRQSMATTRPTTYAHDMQRTVAPRRASARSGVTAANQAFNLALKNCRVFTTHRDCSNVTNISLSIYLKCT